MFHPLNTDIERPRRFTCPFCYEPHPIAVLAAEATRSHIAADEALRREADKGKMFGVLVVENGDGRLGFLAAYSGQPTDGSDRTWFVPPVVDTTCPDGYFKMHEAEITAINHEIDALESLGEYTTLVEEKSRVVAAGETEINDYRVAVREAKARRDELRQSLETLDEEQRATMLRESQYMNACLRRIKRRWRERMEDVNRRITPYRMRIDSLKAERRRLSDNLQQWLYDRYVMLNARGERRGLRSIFAETAGGVPPSGAGDCCAPKLLQYAYEHAFKPVCMAEFWWGASPKNEIRHHGRYYTACRGKCKPILTHMLQGLDVDDDPQMSITADAEIQVLYDDEHIVAVNKPAGVLSVPGSGNPASERNRRSVLSWARDRYPDASGPMIVHRLDMAASGVMIVAKDYRTYIFLQRMFAERKVEKRYVALLEKRLSPAEGTISLPLRPDVMNRPMQVVDRERGKEAVTDYRITDFDGRYTRVLLYPRTGRTHQLRVHCAHADGLGAPIAGDTLYGYGRRDIAPAGSSRLYLHAEAIIFPYPTLDKSMSVEAKADF